MILSILLCFLSVLGFVAISMGSGPRTARRARYALATSSVMLLAMCYSYTLGAR